MILKKILKKILIKLNRFSGYELIDQNEFSFPSLKNKKFNDLSTLNEKSIVLPLGKVPITRKVSSLGIIVRTNSNVHISDQNKKRIFNRNKIDYIEKSLKSLIVSISSFKKKFKNFKVNLIIVDQSNNETVLKKFNEIFLKLDFKVEIVAFDKNEYKNVINLDYNKDVFGNLSSLLKCFNIAKNNADDLTFFLEDDYLHKESLIEEMIMTYERVSSQLNKELLLVPSDYPYLYMRERLTNIVAGSHRHWQTLDKVLCSFMTSKEIIDLYWDNFLLTCQNHNDPIEKHLNEICKQEVCLSPIPSLSIHMANSNSIFGIPPFVDIKNEWLK
ncbi:glycosyltransferase family 2 protein [Candidatus Pelagibacter sp.]|nr:glycosyltransferase family 2 protein [Candidatus Pelagibacter sp.]MDA9631302.1 glycosyltransferase family 2 protein [Candidatus Pelagibacter sp.]